ncbi:MAG: DUF4116 domain-containing protein [Verrucomicrobia bacterium]|nr:DUF4116 domain-containing protein [Verrucomicrobiota bacterium]MDE3047326.1 DUF4116 domain-containing protein [Verrucomicrobiota bacterium]
MSLMGQGMQCNPTTLAIPYLPGDPSQRNEEGEPLLNLVFTEGGQPKITRHTGTGPRLFRLTEEAKRTLRTQYPSAPDQVLTQQQFTLLQELVFGARKTIGVQCHYYAQVARAIAQELFDSELQLALVKKGITQDCEHLIILDSVIPRIERAENETNQYLYHCFLFTQTSALWVVDVGLKTVWRGTDWTEWSAHTWEYPHYPTQLYHLNGGNALQRLLREIHSKPHIKGDWQSAVQWLAESHEMVPSSVSSIPEKSLLSREECTAIDLPKPDACAHALAKAEHTEAVVQCLQATIAGNRDGVLAAVKLNGLALAFTSPKYQDDEDIVDAAFNQNRMAMRWVSDRLRKDIKFAPFSDLW